VTTILKAQAKANGVQFGRSKQLNETEILKLQQRRENGALIRELMADYKLSKATIYRYLTQDKP
jgi:hypothetical protein